MSCEVRSDRALELKLVIARRPLSGAALVEAMAGAVHLPRRHQDQVILADQFGRRIAKGAFDAVVDIGERALGVQGVDHVRRGVHQQPVPLLGLLKLLQHAGVVALELELDHGVAHGLDQLVRLVGLAQVVVGAQAQGLDGGLDLAVAAHDDDAAVGVVLADVGHDVMAAGIGQAQIHQRQVIATPGQQRQRLGAGDGAVDAVYIL